MLRTSKILTAFNAETEVEHLLRAILPDSPYAGLVKAVGGYVRDSYLSLLKNDPSIEAKDLDIVVNLKDGAEKVTKYLHGMFPGMITNPVQLGAGYPIWQITFKSDVEFQGKTFATQGAIIEFADAMKETFPDSNSRQREVESASIEEDIARRDFTVNMLLKDLTTGEVEDLTGTSRVDIEKGVLQGHPDVPLDKMFGEDPLRMIRLIRFNVKYDWSIPTYVLRAVRRNAERINIVSAERIMGELTKIMNMGKLQKAVRLMSVTGLLKYIFPEIEALKGVQQNPKYHAEGDVYRHTLMVLQNAPPGVENQIAALLHDVGKPAVTTMIEGEIKSIGHEAVGAKVADAILRRLKFDGATISKVKSMVYHHMRPHQLAGTGVKSLRKFIRDVGEEMIDSILNLARADELGKLPPVSNIPDIRLRIEEARNMGAPIQGKNRSVLNGKDVMNLLGIPPSPKVKEVMEFLADLEDTYAERGQTLTREDAARDIVERFA